MHEMDLKAALSSEIIREYLKNEAVKLNKVEKVADINDVTAEFTKLEDSIKSNPEVRAIFKKWQEVFSSDTEYTDKVNPKFVEAVMLLDLSDNIKYAQNTFTPGDMAQENEQLEKTLTDVKKSPQMAAQMILAEDLTKLKKTVQEMSGVMRELNAKTPNIKQLTDEYTKIIVLYNILNKTVPNSEFKELNSKIAKMSWGELDNLRGKDDLFNRLDKLHGYYINWMKGVVYPDKTAMKMAQELPSMKQDSKGPDILEEAKARKAETDQTAKLKHEQEVKDNAKQISLAESNAVKQMQTLISKAGSALLDAGFVDPEGQKFSVLKDVHITGKWDMATDSVLKVFKNTIYSLLEKYPETLATEKGKFEANFTPKNDEINTSDFGGMGAPTIEAAQKNSAVIADVLTGFYSLAPEQKSNMETIVDDLKNKVLETHRTQGELIPLTVNKETLAVLNATAGILTEFLSMLSDPYVFEESEGEILNRMNKILESHKAGTRFKTIKEAWEKLNNLEALYRKDIDNSKASK